ncbi:MAG TPA: sigma-70 family RNA polymerase sigma factor [Candidatus Eisenbergiella merdavium]|uniref:Sigma-70 family RNA polymerase sigma factor n=1 Tax=Candidatus Eisenbergiella merdavium TaxID=2838551 RepID=A0A9D2SQH0_9FIRM|nr:sigma-70 family RNA polymerase sigma factor [Candidatus Eisenbergiella merdavium]
MGEFVELINDIRKDKEEFYRLIDKFEPLIRKYTKKLYKDDKEDVREEFLLALWESVQGMEYYKSDAEIVKYINNAVWRKFLELYRASRKQHDLDSGEGAEENPQNLIYEEKEYGKMLFRQDIELFINKFTGMKKTIFRLIMEENLSDAEIAARLHKSRQYIHRMRKYLYDELREYIKS